MRNLPDNSIDLILVDPPYGITACQWDSIIPLEAMWEEVRRVIKDNSGIIFTTTQPFTSRLILSNVKKFKHELIWQKNRPTGFLNSKYAPLKSHENVLVFGNNGKIKYNPQLTHGHKATNGARGKGHSPTFGPCGMRNTIGGNTTRHPITVVKFDSERGFHPTQKPVGLFEYLIKTYSNENDIVLDFCMGSGTTALACLKLNRKFIGYEISKEYCDIAEKRIEGWRNQTRLPSFGSSSSPPAPGQQEMENSDCKNPVMYCFECTESIGKT
jgi:site-specific DNA-methyltransferase (adenine-specific)